MKRTLKDTDRNVKFVIDNQDRAEVWASGDSRPWTANVYVDGDLVLTEAELGATPAEAFAKIVVEIEKTTELNDLPVPVPEKDKDLLLMLLEKIGDTWGHPSDVPDWRENEYLRGQLELVIEMCRVVTDEEYERGDGDIDQQRDRITTWIEQEVWK
jgi:hypothetical protein